MTDRHDAEHSCLRNQNTSCSFSALKGELRGGKLHVDHMNWFYFTKIVENVTVYASMETWTTFFAVSLLHTAQCEEKNLSVDWFPVSIAFWIRFSLAAMQLIRKRHQSARSQWNKDKNVDFSLCKRNRTLLMEKAKTVTVTRGYQRGATAAALSASA